MRSRSPTEVSGNAIPEPEMDDKDRHHHLPDDGKPAKLDQKKQVLLVG